jgi:hypothetical protein
MRNQAKDSIHWRNYPDEGQAEDQVSQLRGTSPVRKGELIRFAPSVRTIRIASIMARYLYGQDGDTIGYMDSNDKYLYSTAGTTIAYWDSTHKYMYTPSGQTLGYLDSRGRYLYSQSGETVGYFQPPYGGND